MWAGGEFASSVQCLNLIFGDYVLFIGFVVKIRPELWANEFYGLFSSAKLLKILVRTLY